MSFWKGFMAVQKAMGSSEPSKSDFKTNRLSRWFNTKLWRSSSRRNHEMERNSGCIHCGQEGSVETGPCGGAVAMNHCHACGRNYYGGDGRMSSKSQYAKYPSYYYDERLADGSWV